MSSFLYAGHEWSKIADMPAPGTLSSLTGFELDYHFCNFTQSCHANYISNFSSFPWVRLHSKKIENGNAYFDNLILSITHVCSNDILIPATFRIKERYNFFARCPSSSSFGLLQCQLSQPKSMDIMFQYINPNMIFCNFSMYSFTQLLRKTN